MGIQTSFMILRNKTKQNLQMTDKDKTSVDTQGQLRDLEAL